MGEAKHKLAAVRANFLTELDKWSFAPSEWEERTIKEIARLATVKVTRYPDDKLEWMRMLPRQCHANARFMEKNDPKGCLKQVTGWWLQDGNYVLHSIVDQHGKFMCVTPVPTHRENTFCFIPDPEIEWREEGDYYEAYRDGVRINVGVRSNPVKVLSELDVIRQRLNSGMNPYKAVQNDINQYLK